MMELCRLLDNGTFVTQSGLAVQGCSNSLWLRVLTGDGESIQVVAMVEAWMRTMGEAWMRTMVEAMVVAMQQNMLK